MNLLFINICVPWVFELYKEYIISIYLFIKKYYSQINISIIFYDLDKVDIIELQKINYANFDKIIYTGDISIFNNIVSFINNNNKIYFLNIEQLSHVNYYNMIKNVDNRVSFLDYSEENISYIKTFSNQSIIIIPPYFEVSNDNIININNKNIDILTILNNDYRKDFFNNIQLDPKYNTMILRQTFDKERNEIFSKSKIYINIHGSEMHNTMELIRIVNLIMHKVIVISQNSICSNLLFLKDYIIIANDIKHFKEYVDEILSNYEFYYNKIYENFDIISYNNYIKENIDLFLFS
jgi:hypothetical protein